MKFALTRTDTMISLGIVGQPPIVTKQRIPSSRYREACWEYGIRATFGNSYHPTTLISEQGTTDEVSGNINVKFGDHLLTGIGNGISGIVDFSRINMALVPDSKCKLRWQPYHESPIVVTFLLNRRDMYWSVYDSVGHDRLFDAIRYEQLLPMPWSSNGRTRLD